MQVAITEEAPDEKPKQLLPTLMPRPSPSPPPIFETQNTCNTERCIQDLLQRVLLTDFEILKHKTSQWFPKKPAYNTSSFCSLLRDFKGKKMWCLERDRKRREKVPSPPLPHSLRTLPRADNDSSTRHNPTAYCVRTDGRTARAAKTHARERERERERRNRSHASCCGEETRATLASERRRRRRRRRPPKEKAPKGRGFLVPVANKCTLKCCFKSNYVFPHFCTHCTKIVMLIVQHKCAFN